MSLSEVPVRNVTREDVALPAWLEGRPGQLLQCTIASISNDGAQLAISPTFELPSRFALRLTEDGKVRRGCRVLWRNGNRTGVRFFALPGVNAVPA